MKKQAAKAEFFKEKKKLLLVILLILLLAVTVYLFFGTDNSQASTSYENSYTETEQRLANILSAIEGVGNVKLYVTEADGEISGVVIVCSGADSILVRNNVLNAVSTALDIDKKIIAIYSM